jgi:hypothetical protein
MSTSGLASACAASACALASTSSISQPFSLELHTLSSSTSTASGSAILVVVIWKPVASRPACTVAEAPIFSSSRVTRNVVRFAVVLKPRYSRYLLAPEVAAASFALPAFT